jgi:hypothetical protein
MADLLSASALNRFLAAFTPAAQSPALAARKTVLKVFHNAD